MIESANLSTQVIIIGAGPTGLSMAAQLTRLGIDYIIIEKNEGTTKLSKALVVQARTLEIFRELGIADEAISRGRIAVGLTLFNHGKTVTSIDLEGLGEGLSAYPFVLSLEQSKTETLLNEYLAGHDKKIQWNTEFTGLTQDENSVTVQCKSNSGNNYSVNGRWLVGCDGASSKVRHELGLAFVGSTEPKLFYVADVMLQSSVINENRVYMFMIKKGFVLFFPMEGCGHYRIVGILPDVKNFDRQFSFSDVEPIIEKSIEAPVEITALRWFSTYKVHSRKADHFQKGRCFIAGDAAHIHTPAGGQGMNTGIQDAYNLAWKIALTVRNEVTPAILRTYNSEREANAKHLLSSTDRMFDIMSGVNPFWNFLRLKIIPPLLRRLMKSKLVENQIFPLLSQTGIAYPDSALTKTSSIGKVKAGDRMPYFVFSNGSDIFGYLTAPVFKVIFFGDEGANALQLSIEKFGLEKLHFSEIPETIFGDQTGFYILLRPDNHISYMGKDIQEITALLKKFAER